MSLRFVLPVAMLIGVASTPVFAEEKPATLTVTGQGIATAQPDRATLTFAAVAQGKNAAEAQVRVSEMMNASVAAITALGLPANALTTTGITLHPLYRESSSSGESRITGYRASNRMQARVDAAKAGAVIDALVGAGINEIESVALGLGNDGGLRRAALGDAVRNAQGEAQAIATAMGVTLLAVDEISEQAVGFNAPMLRSMAMKSSGGATPVETGEIRIEASVLVRYRVSSNVTAPAP